MEVKGKPATEYVPKGLRVAIIVSYVSALLHLSRGWQIREDQVSLLARGI